MHSWLVTTETEPVQIPAQATFTDMKAGTAQDWHAIASHAIPFAMDLPTRVLAHLRLLDGDFGGFPIDRLSHCLQTAARAERAGKPDDYVLCALLHDIGDTLGSYNHQEIAAAIVHPFVTEDLHWMVNHHAEFQGQYFFGFIGLDPNVREQYQGTPYFDLTQEFVEDYDSPAFDSKYDTPPLEHFEPLVQQLMAKPLNSIYKDMTE